MKSISTICITLLTLFPSLNAQGEKGRKISMRLACVSFAGDVRELSYLSHNGSWENIGLSIRGSSDPVVTRVPGRELFLYRANEKPDKDGTVQPVARVKLPLEGNSFTVILFPGSKKGVVYRGVAISDREFRFGCTCIFNTTRAPLMMKVGQARHRIAPKAPSIVNHRLGGKDRSTKVQFFAGKAKRPFYSANWHLRPDTRETHVIYIDPRTNRPRMKTLVDVKPSKTGPAANS